MYLKTKGWPPERRRAQAERIRQWKPWRFSTGPRSRAGKDKVSMNAFRHGLSSKPVRDFVAVLRRQQKFIKDIERHCLRSGFPVNLWLLEYPSLPESTF